MGCHVITGRISTGSRFLVCGSPFFAKNLVKWGKEMKKEKKKFRWRQWLPIFLMGLPGMIYMFINNYLPLYGLAIAFKK